MEKALPAVHPRKYSSQQFKGHSGPIYGLAWGPDGKQIATASADLTVGLWDAGGKALGSLSHKDSVAAVAFRPSSDGKPLAALDFSRRITFWPIADVKSPAKDKEEVELKIASPAYSLTWGPGGKSVLIAAGKQVYYLKRDK
jgi:WD40 repeat protein